MEIIAKENGIALLRVRTTPHNSTIIVDPLRDNSRVYGIGKDTIPGDGRIYLGCPAFLYRKPGETEEAFLARAQREADDLSATDCEEDW